METVACNIVYLDRRANDEYVRRDTLSESLVARTSTGTFSPGYFSLGKPPPVEVHANVEAILSLFTEVHICGSGSSCLAKISQLLTTTRGAVPTIVLIDVPYDEERRRKRLSREPRTPSPTSTRSPRPEANEPDDIYGMHFLAHVCSEIHSKNFSKLVVPVVVLTGLDHERDPSSLQAPSHHGTDMSTDPLRMLRYLDAGATDVLPSPLTRDRVHNLAVHAYRTRKESSKDQAAFLTAKRSRKMSWVGVNDQKPYAYLREAMVSNLMSGICNPESVGDTFDASDVFVAQDRREHIATAIGKWHFSAHEFTDDEMVYAALLMMKHAISVPELEKFHLSDEKLTVFLLASRTAYNEFVLYHNFRHVIDVLQAVFHSLVTLGVLPPYGAAHEVVDKPPIVELLTPFDGLALLVSAIGHDVGHPGVNNAFLVALNAPLAQLYNDRSVLESFHCAAFSQILRRYWPAAFLDTDMRKAMINNILATDMGLHFKYMADLGDLKEQLEVCGGSTESWIPKTRADCKDLLCGVLIKCADISNVARKFSTAWSWAHVLSDEFINQGQMEEELEIPTQLFGGPPVKGDLVRLGQSQIGFIDVFAGPLFGLVAELLPRMRFALDEIHVNQEIWRTRVEEEKARRAKRSSIVLGIDPSEPRKSLPNVTETGHSSSGSGSNTLPASGPSSTAGDQSSMPPSAPAISGSKSLQSLESPTPNQSRRGSADASITAILVTQTPEKQVKETGRGHGHSASPSRRKDTSTKVTPRKSREKPSQEGEAEGLRPLTAPSTARRPTGTNLFPLGRQCGQSHSDVDLPHSNGGMAEETWQMAKDATASAPNVAETSREPGRRPEWWRKMSSRRRTRVAEAPAAAAQSKDNVLQAVVSNTTASSTVVPVSPGKRRADKIKSFFRRKPGQSEEGQPKQLSSYGSSSQLRTPPTSDPGYSVHSQE